jgi:acetyl-CoA carboxylase carboxyltransferase component
MDSKAIGNDVCLAWPSAEIAVMGAKGAAQVLRRDGTEEERRELEERYAEELLGPWVAAERRYVDEVIDPADTRVAVWRALDLLSTRRERLPRRKHDAGPM